MRILINNWEKYNHRKDVKATSWFRLNNDWIIDPKFYNFDPSEKMVWIYLLSHSSRKMKPEFHFDPDFTAHLLNLKRSKIDSAINKLQAVECITLRARNAGVTDTIVDVPLQTDRQTDRQTFRTKTPYREIAILWNTICGVKYRKIQNPEKLNKSRKDKLTSRWKQKPSLVYWEKMFKHLSEKCDFSWSKNWSPNFDWIIKNDLIHDKILEGAYDKKPGDSVAKLNLIT